MFCYCWCEKNIVNNSDTQHAGALYLTRALELLGKEHNLRLLKLEVRSGVMNLPDEVLFCHLFRHPLRSQLVRQLERISGVQDFQSIATLGIEMEEESTEYEVFQNLKKLMEAKPLADEPTLGISTEASRPKSLMEHIMRAEDHDLEQQELKTKQQWTEEFRKMRAIEQTLPRFQALLWVIRRRRNRNSISAG